MQGGIKLTYALVIYCHMLTKLMKGLKMSTSNIQNDKNKKLNQKYTVKNALVNYYLFLIFTVFPLFATNAYFNIRHDKYYLFIIFSALIILAEAALVLSVKADNKNKLCDEPVTGVKKNIWYKSFSFTDWAMLAFLAVSFISSALSKHPLDAILGTAGRNNGLLLIALYVGVYFLIPRYYCFMDYVFLALAGASAVVYLLSILNCFYIDPLGMFSRLTDEKTITDFTSTIGNKNLMSSYICITLPVFIAMSVHTKKSAYRAIYLTLTGLGFAALMTADSDSGILGIGVFLVIYFVWYSRKIARLKRFFLSLTVMLGCAKLLRLFSFLMNDKSKGMDDFQKLFVYSRFGFVVLAVVAIITVLLYLIDNKKPEIVLSRAVPITLGVLAALCAIGIVGTVVYFSRIDTVADLKGFKGLLRFDDEWGTHRGFMWIRSMWIFNDFSLVEKLFGCGPDNYYYAFQPYFSGLQKYGDSSTNAAHNEYINYLITIGITGLLSFLAVLGGAITRAVKSAQKNPLAIVCVSAVICYSVQAVVNISQPITTPLFILFIALCEAVSRQTKLTGKNSFDVGEC